MPPHHHHHHHHRHHHDHFRPSRSLSRMLEGVEKILDNSMDARRVGDFAFHDGPGHRRATNGVLAGILYQLLQEATRSLGQTPVPYRGESAEVECTGPPHLRHHRRGGSTVSIPTRLLSTLCDSRREMDELLENLSDAPEHDVASNAILLGLFEALYDVLAEGGHVRHSSRNGSVG